MGIFLVLMLTVGLLGAASTQNKPEVKKATVKEVCISKGSVKNCKLQYK